MPERRGFDGDVLEVAYSRRKMGKRLYVVLFRSSSGAEVDGHVLGRGLEPVEGISKVFPASMADDHLVGSKIATLRFSARLVCPLPMTCAAVTLRATRTTGGLERSPTPGAVSHPFRHSDGTLPHDTERDGDQTSRRSIR